VTGQERVLCRVPTAGGTERSAGGGGGTGTLAWSADDSATTTLDSRLGASVDDPRDVLGPPQVVGEFNDLGRARVVVLGGLGVLVEEPLEFVHGVQAAPCLVGQLPDPVPHVHASHDVTSRLDVMRRTTAGPSLTQRHAIMSRDLHMI